jgi:hypothetical protein
MKNRVMDTVNMLLQRSGQYFPAKNMSRDDHSVQVYDVEHWPDIFNTLLIHDFPSIVVSFDTSTSSLSGFVVTLQWRSVVDASAWVGAVVHILFMLLVLCMVFFAIWTSLQNITPDEMKRVHAIYVLDRNSSTGEAPTSLLAEHLRVVMVNNEL